MKLFEWSLVAALAVTSLQGCGDDDESTTDGDNNGVALSTERSGALVGQDGPATRGAVSIGRDDAGKRYIVLAENFESDFATGSVALFLAKSSANLETQRSQDSANVSPRIAVVSKNGAQRFEIPSTVDASAFNYVVVYCESVEINFGAAALQPLQLTTLRSGTLANQDGPPTSGMVTIATGSDGLRYLVLADDFSSDFATGTVTIYLAKGTGNLAEQRTAAAGNVSARIGRVSENGAHAFAIPSTITDTTFSSVIVYCETVQINFAAATLN